MPKMLFVEDEVELREMIATIIEEVVEGIEIDQVSSGNEAIEVLSKDNSYNLIVSDYSMQDGTGGTLFKHLKENDNKIPFLLLSGGYLDDYEEFNDHEEVDFFQGIVQKPFEYETLFEAIKKGIDASSAEVKSVTEPVPFEKVYIGIASSVFQKTEFYNFNAYKKLNDEKYVQFLSEAEHETNKEQFEHFIQNENRELVYIEMANLNKMLSLLQKNLFEKNYVDKRKLEKCEIGTSVFLFSKLTLEYLGISKNVMNSVDQQIELISNEIQKKKKLGEILEEFSSSGEYLSSHSILGAYVGIQVLSNLGKFEPSLARKTFWSFLFHDIALDSEKLAKVRGKDIEGLSRVEKQIVLDHPKQGKEILSQLIDVGDEDILKVIEDHHEKPDGTGFPRGIHASQFSFLQTVFCVSHTLVDFLYESDFYVGGAKAFVEGLPESYRTDNFKPAYEALFKLVEKH
ncbi:MAG: response regulator [Bacteriovoracaceae bacterium]